MSNRFLVIKNDIVTNVIVGQIDIPDAELIEKTDALKRVGVGWVRQPDGSFTKPEPATGGAS
jgi:hypothetical protein